MHKAAFWYDIVQRQISIFVQIIVRQFWKGKYLVDFYIGKRNEGDYTCTYVNKIGLFYFF